VEKICFLFFLVSVVVDAPKGQETKPSDIALQFEGNRVFSQQELLAVTEKCLATDPHWNGRIEPEPLAYCSRKLQAFLGSKGYLKATVGKAQTRQLQDKHGVIIHVDEGALYRLGEVRIEGAKLLSSDRIRELLDLKRGDIADGENW
jgi:outer membrane protein assembly factor BamA